MRTIKANQYCYNTKTKRKHSDIQYIVIHYTANNNDTAEGNCNYYKVGGTHENGVKQGNLKPAGAHFFIDQKGEIIKSVPMDRVAWSVGGSLYSDIDKTGGGKLHTIATNANSVSIELCDIATKEPSKSQLEAVRKVIKYIRKYCKNANQICRHFDITGKHCPSRYMNENSWDKFLFEIGELNHKAKLPKSKDFRIQIITDSLNMRKEPNASATLIASLRKGEIYTIVETKGNWGRIKSGGWVNTSSNYVKRL